MVFERSNGSRVLEDARFSQDCLLKSPLDKSHQKVDLHVLPWPLSWHSPQSQQECERFSPELEYHSSKTAPPWLGDFHGNSKNLLTVHSQNFHHRVIGIPASSSKFHHGFDFVHGVLRCSWVATSGSTDRGVLAMEIGASAGPTLAMEIGASAPGIEWLGQRR
uniref:Uncharacterized protein n=1 Tax=Fagus sylvatica TaxID=28930 RepID=A0A2N9IXX3_FAGSY